MKKLEKKLSPMTFNELFGIIDKSENDIKIGKVTEVRSLLKQIDRWK